MRRSCLLAASSDSLAGTSPVLADTTATLTATAPNGLTGSGSIKVLAPTVLSVTCPTATYTGAGKVYAQVILDGIAPVSYTLACSSSSTSAVIASSFAFPANHGIAEIPITVKAVTAKTVVTITVAGKTFSLTLLP